MRFSSVATGSLSDESAAVLWFRQCFHVIAEKCRIAKRNIRRLFPLVKRAGVIFAVYLGIYTILPGCLCQILGVLGLAPAAMLEAGQQRVIASLSSDQPCHCHEVSGKILDLVPQPAYEIEAFTTVVGTVAGLTSVLPGISKEDLYQGRAPPVIGRFGWNRLRNFTGVFLI